MGSFGEDLRMERLARGIALEQITAVTKISQRHLLALEQERFRLLPGGILSKGIVRGYANALGLDEQDWTERFLRACDDAGQEVEDQRGWTAFATNVGKARILRHDAVELRLRWVGAILVLLVLAARLPHGALLRHARRLVDNAAAHAHLRFGVPCHSGQVRAYDVAFRPLIGCRQRSNAAGRFNANALHGNPTGRRLRAPLPAQRPCNL